MWLASRVTVLFLLPVSGRSEQWSALLLSWHALWIGDLSASSKAHGLPLPRSQYHQLSPNSHLQGGDRAPLCFYLALLCFKISVTRAVIRESRGLSFPSPVYVPPPPRPHIYRQVSETLASGQNVFLHKVTHWRAVVWILAILHLGFFFFFCQLIWRSIMFLQSVISVDMSQSNATSIQF